MSSQSVRSLSQSPASRRLFSLLASSAFIAALPGIAFAQAVSVTTAGSGALGIGTAGSSTVASLTVSPASTGDINFSSSLTFNGAPLGTANNADNFIVNNLGGNAVYGFGALTINGGAVRGEIATNATGNVRLVFDSATVNNGGWLLFNRSTLKPGTATIAAQTSTTANVVFTSAPALSTSGTGTGTQIGVVPWAVVWDGNSSNRGIATYDATSGLRSLTSSETASFASGMSAGQNAVLGGNVTLAANTSVNSLDITGNSRTITNAGFTLTVASGAIHGNQTFTIGGSVGDGALAFGAARGYVSLENGRAGTINSVITGSGGLSVYLDTFNGDSANLVLAAANTFTGTTTIASNRAGSNTKLNLTNSLALQNSTLDYNNHGGTVAFANSLTAFTLGGLKGAQNLALTNNAAAAVALSVGNNNENTTYSGVLSGSGSITKIGTGTWTLSGANTFSGGTNIGAGTVHAASATALGSGPVAIAGGALTSGVGSLTGLGAVSLSSGSIALNGTGAGSFASSSFTMSGGTWTVSIGDSAAISGNVSITGGTLDASAFLGNEATYTSVSGYALFSSIGGTGSVSGLSITGYNTSEYSASLSDAGLLSFSAVPEPSAFAMLAGLGTLGFAASRRRRRA